MVGNLARSITLRGKLSTQTGLLVGRLQIPMAVITQNELVDSQGNHIIDSVGNQIVSVNKTYV